MPSVHPTPHATPMPIFIISTKDNSCFNRTNKIALAIFASLAGFFLLPFVTALACSSLVTLAAVAYCPENNPLIIRPASPRTREARDGEIEVVSSIEKEGEPLVKNTMSPISIDIVDTAHLNTPPDTVIVRFNSEKALANFIELEEKNFSVFSTIKKREGETTSINICLNDQAIEEGVTINQINSTLKKIFGDDLPVIAYAVD